MRAANRASRRDIQKQKLSFDLSLERTTKYIYFVVCSATKKMGEQDKSSVPTPPPVTEMGNAHVALESPSSENTFLDECAEFFKELCGIWNCPCCINCDCIESRAKCTQCCFEFCACCCSCSSEATAFGAAAGGGDASGGGAC